MNDVYIRSLLRRAMVFVEEDAMMMAAVTRHAPLPPEEQAEHDSTLSSSETLLDEYLFMFPEERQHMRSCRYYKPGGVE